MIKFPSAWIISTLILSCPHWALADSNNQLPTDGDVVVAPSAAKIADSKLLLPASYRKYFSSLQRATELAAETEQCKQFLQGGLQLDRSESNHPIFRILCRDERGQSYALLVDGLSLMLIDETRPGGTVSFAALQQELDEARERQRLLDERSAKEALAEATRLEDLELLRAAQELVRLENERKLALWNHCVQELKLRVQNMHSVVWLTQVMPDSQSDEDNRLSYQIDFNAQDLYQQPLYYRAECLIQDKANYDLLIRPRRDEVSR